jgi:hypothetical protein
MLRQMEQRYKTLTPGCAGRLAGGLRVNSLTDERAKVLTIGKASPVVGSVDAERRAAGEVRRLIARDPGAQRSVALLLSVCVNCSQFDEE